MTHSFDFDNTGTVVLHTQIYPEYTRQQIVLTSYLNNVCINLSRKSQLTPSKLRQLADELEKLAGKPE